MSNSFKQNINRDAMLVRLNMAGMQVIAGQRFDMTPDQLLQHGKWLAKQPKSYRDKVVAKVEEIIDAE
ncbi:MAG: hypothetical protein ACTHJR_10975 [Sphingomonas sp.]|uniref:hypothetical protein n=1 Tax=Sphingomonas sp. TaxID=28214 RepID=UPI003F7D34F1